jgi:hypothetical protein
MAINISCSTTSSLKQKYPYGLLTDDYGILSEDDLGIYAWWAKPKLYDENDTAHGYMYWQCFPTSNVKLGCRKIEGDDPKIPYSDAEIKIETETEIHEYEFRRALELEACHAYLKNWNRLIFGEKVVCFGGKPVDVEQKRTHGKLKKVTGWIYDKLKTKKGCYSYFGKHCDIEYWRSQGYPHSKSHP